MFAVDCEACGKPFRRAQGFGVPVRRGPVP